MKDHCTTGLQFNKTGTDQKEQMLFFVCSEAGESKLVKLETSRTVILTMSVLWLNLPLLIYRYLH